VGLPWALPAQDPSPDTEGEVVPAVLVDVACEACGREHTFGLPDGPVAEGYWYVCPESAELVTLPSNLVGEAVEHNPPDAVPLSPLCERARQRYRAERDREEPFGATHPPRPEAPVANPIAPRSGLEPYPSDGVQAGGEDGGPSEPPAESRRLAPTPQMTVGTGLLTRRL
jgi:hypothetical protein